MKNCIAAPSAPDGNSRNRRFVRPCVQPHPSVGDTLRIHSNALRFAERLLGLRKTGSQEPSRYQSN